MAWVNLGQAAHVVQAALDRRLEAAAGVSGAEYELLLRLGQEPRRPLQMTEIAGLLLSSRSGATRLVDRLVEAGLVARETPSENRRAVYVRLRPEGEAVLARAQAAFEESFEVVFSAHLSDRDVSELRKILRKLLEGNGAWAAERCEPLTAPSPEPGEPISARPARGRGSGPG